MNKRLNNRESYCPAPNKLSNRHFKPIKPLILAACLFACLPGLSHAEIVTHPLSDAPTPAAENPNPATPPQSEDPKQSNQTLTDFNEQLGDKKLGECSMKYKLEGFSLAYKQYDGTGEISCRNGQKTLVALSSKSIGFTIGYSVIEGEAYFTEVKTIGEIFGDYISLGNHFGFNNSVDRQVLTRGEISLVMLGRGKGFDIGFTIGDLSIKPRAR